MNKNIATHKRYGFIPEDKGWKRRWFIIIYGEIPIDSIDACGYSIIAVLTGIVSAELKSSRLRGVTCQRCGNEENDDDARYCKTCGEKLELKNN